MWPATGTPGQYMSLVRYDRPPLQASSIYNPYTDAVTCRNGAERDRCPQQRVGSGTIPTRYCIFIQTEDVGPINITFDVGLLKVGVY